MAVQQPMPNINVQVHVLQETAVVSGAKVLDHFDFITGFDATCLLLFTQILV